LPVVKCPQQMKTSSMVIRNALVVSSSDTQSADILIRNGRIEAVGSAVGSADEEIDARGLHALPGALDPQVHFRDPGMQWKEDLESGSRAAAAGGVTAFFDMPNTVPNTTTRELMAEKKQIASRKCLVNYGFFIGATSDNLTELNAVENVPGIKIFMAASTGSLLISDRRDVEHIFANGKRLIAVHSEDQAIIEANKAQYAGSTNVEDHMRIRSADAALASTRFLVEMARKYERRLHILHLTTRDEVEYLRAEKIAGLISTELCPQHFLLKAPDDYERLGTYAQMNPPIRTAEHGAALWQGLKDGVIDCMATDHAPHSREEKDKPFGEAPAGMPGVETLMPLMLHQANQGRCRVNDVVKWLCEKPVQLYGVQAKGRIAPGFDADIVLVDLKQTKTIRDGQLHSKCNWSPYNGWEIQGWPVITLVNGNVVFRDGEFFDEVKGREVVFRNQSEGGSG